MNLYVLNIALSFLNSRFFPTDCSADFVVVVELQVLAQPPVERGVGRIDGIFEQCKVTVQGFHRDGEGALNDMATQDEREAAKALTSQMTLAETNDAAALGSVEHTIEDSRVRAGFLYGFFE